MVATRNKFNLRIAFITFIPFSRLPNMFTLEFSAEPTQQRTGTMLYYGTEKREVGTCAQMRGMPVVETRLARMATRNAGENIATYEERSLLFVAWTS
jgi:hypothetical protein